MQTAADLGAFKWISSDPFNSIRKGAQTHEPADRTAMSGGKTTTVRAWSIKWRLHVYATKTGRFLLMLAAVEVPLRFKMSVSAINGTLGLLELNRVAGSYGDIDLIR